MRKFKKFFKQLFCRHKNRVVLFEGQLIQPGANRAYATIYGCEKCLMVLDVTIVNELPRHQY